MILYIRSINGASMELAKLSLWHEEPVYDKMISLVKKTSLQEVSYNYFYCLHKPTSPPQKC